MNTYNIYNMQNLYSDRKQEAKRIFESSKKQIRS